MYSIREFAGKIRGNFLKSVLAEKKLFIIGDEDDLRDHYRTIEALEFSIDPQKKLIPTLDKRRKKRNIGSYDDFGLVSQGEADHCGKVARRVRTEVEDWIRKNNPDKIS